MCCGDVAGLAAWREEFREKGFRSKTLGTGRGRVSRNGAKLATQDRVVGCCRAFELWRRCGLGGVA
jgi:hypothetical protein